MYISVVLSIAINLIIYGVENVSVNTTAEFCKIYLGKMHIMIMNFFFNILKGYWSLLIALATHGNLN